MLAFCRSLFVIFNRKILKIYIRPLKFYLVDQYPVRTQKFQHINPQLLIIFSYLMQNVFSCVTLKDRKPYCLSGISFLNWASDVSLIDIMGYFLLIVTR